MSNSNFRNLFAVMAAGLLGASPVQAQNKPSPATSQNYRNYDPDLSGSKKSVEIALDSSSDNPAQKKGELAQKLSNATGLNIIDATFTSTANGKHVTFTHQKDNRKILGGVTVWNIDKEKDNTSENVENKGRAKFEGRFRDYVNLDTDQKRIFMAIKGVIDSNPELCAEQRDPAKKRSISTASTQKTTHKLGR